MTLTYTRLKNKRELVLRARGHRDALQAALEPERARPQHISITADRTPPEAAFVV